MPNLAERFAPNGEAPLWTISTALGVPILLCNGGPGCCSYLGPLACMIDVLARLVRWEQLGYGHCPLAIRADAHAHADDDPSPNATYTPTPQSAYAPLALDDRG